jgi:orotate phosphoribosyltransferase
MPLCITLYGLSVSIPSELIRRGHFVFESGHHGDTWLELDLLISRPDLVRPAAADLAALLDSYDATLVCGPLDGGAFLAQWVAGALGTSFAYTRPDGIPPALPVAGHRAIVVDDAINAGFATTAAVHALRAASCEVIALASAIVCAPAGLEVGPRLGLPQHFLEQVTTRLWPADKCPECQAMANGSRSSGVRSDRRRARTGRPARPGR